MLEFVQGAAGLLGLTFHFLEVAGLTMHNFCWKLGKFPSSLTTQSTQTALLDNSASDPNSSGEKASMSHFAFHVQMESQATLEFSGTSLSVIVTVSPLPATSSFIKQGICGVFGHSPRFFLLL